MKSLGLASLLALLLLPLTAAAQAASPQAASPQAGSPDATDTERAWRASSLHLGSDISGATGLLHVSEAGAGASGTFRIALASSSFSGSGFLCSASAPCPALGGDAPGKSDDASRVGLHMGLSATLLPFLEAYGALHNHSTSNSRGRPQLIDSLGDSALGLKAFTPRAPDKILSFGGTAELLLLSGSGSVGVDSAGTSFAFRALSTLDLDNRSNAQSRVPLRFHLNLGYKFDNSGNLVRSVEHTPPPDGLGQSVPRITRFGLNVNRVDLVQFGVGGEFVHEYLRPFVEWTLDVPANRQGYVCHSAQAQANGEGCLASNQGIATSPSRLTLGLRGFPWASHGLSLLGAVDIGTSGTAKFVEEIVPELPWNLWLAIGYGFDTVPPAPIVQRVEAPAPPPAPAPALAVEYFVQGVVLEKDTTNPIADAAIKFDGRSITGMLSRDDGTFRSAQLEPGTYTFDVSASGYHDAQCSVTIDPSAATPSEPPPAQPSVPPAAKGPADAPPSSVFSVKCELEALPKVGSVLGSLLDAESNAPVGGAQVLVTDKLNRELRLGTDGSGTVRFENVPPGTVTLRVEADGYLSSVSEVTVRAHEETQARILLNKRPAQPNVVVAGREIRLKKQVHFQSDSAEILPDSMGILEELAELLKNKPALKEVEVQGHTDDTGNAAYNQRLSQERAQAVVDAIAKLGVDAARMSAKGYGQSKPLVPNSNEANRAKNRRVQVMITEQGK